MEKLIVARLNIRFYDTESSTSRDEAFDVSARVEKIYESTKRYYAINGTNISKRISFVTPRVSHSAAEAEAFMDGLKTVEMYGIVYEILSGSQSNNRTTLDLRSVL